MQEVLIDFEFKIQEGNPPFLLNRIETGEKVTDIQFLSSGETQLL